MERKHKTTVHSLLYSNRGLLLIVAALTLLILFGHAEFGSAAEPTSTPFSKISTAGGYERLAAMAQKNGSVKIIIKVNVQSQPMGQLSESEAASHMSHIAQAQDKVLEKLSGQNVIDYHKYQFIPYIAMTVDKAALDALLAIPEVEKIEEDHLSSYRMNWNMTKIGAPNAWSMCYDGSGYAIAVLDTGVDSSHPFLTEAVVSEACYSTNNTNSHASSVCPGGSTSSTASGSAMPYAGNCPTGECDHGTHVAGIAAGRNNSSLSGVANKASIIAIQVFSRFDSTSACGQPSCVMSYDSDQIKGLERVYTLRNTYKVAAINLSLGGGQYYSDCDSDYSSYKASVDNLRSAGIATLIASGNESYTDSISGPACISTAISVGSTDSSDNVSDFSNSASFLSLLAPGSSINSSIPGGNYATWNGTSMATPHVAGAWAVLKQAKPSASVTEILNALTSTGVSVTDSRNGITKPRIQLDTAVQSLGTGSTFTLTVSKTGSGSGTVKSDDGKIDCGGTCQAQYSSSVTVTLTATPDNGSTLASWSGCDSTSGSQCTVTTTSAKTVTATFNTVQTSGKKSVYDFDGDSKSDILWRSTSGTIYVTLMNGWQPASGGKVFTIGSDWQIVGVGDFNGDGKSDILWRHTSGTIYVTLMNGWQGTGGGIVGTVGSDWQIAGVGDFDGDGKSDILWRHTSGTIYVTLMNGWQGTSGGTVGTVGSDWQIQ
ncbi:MAG: S8 family serine peptidase [Nitrospirae bacterium]|nr:S8 family serine peptidase [Nitrospirota bacterium]